jgi:hypothetical protein
MVAVMKGVSGKVIHELLPPNQRFHQAAFGWGSSPVDFWSRCAMTGGTVVCAAS